MHEEKRTSNRNKYFRETAQYGSAAARSRQFVLKTSKTSPIQNFDNKIEAFFRKFWKISKIKMTILFSSTFSKYHKNVATQVECLICAVFNNIGK